MNNENFYDEMREILQPYVGIEEGNDDFVFGNYVEWPKLENLEDDQIKALLAYFGIEVFFGETKDVCIDDIKLNFLTEYSSSQLSLVCLNEEITVLKNYEEKNTKLVYSIKIPNISHVKEEVCELLRQAGVPEGTDYENGGMSDYPASFKYFGSQDDEYLWYKEFSIEYQEYKDQISRIKEMINDQKNLLVKKSLLLSAFVYTESYVKSIIVERIPDIDSNIENIHLNKIIREHIEYSLERNTGREELFKEFYGIKLPKIPNVQIRNNLAHDIANVKLEKDTIKYYDKSKNEQSENIESIFSKLQSFSDRLENIKKESSQM